MLLRATAMSSDGSADYAPPTKQVRSETQAVLLDHPEVKMSVGLAQRGSDAACRGG